MYTTRKLRAVRARGEVVWVKREMQNTFLLSYFIPKSIVPSSPSALLSGSVSTSIAAAQIQVQLASLALPSPDYHPVRVSRQYSGRVPRAQSAVGSSSRP